MGIKRNPHTTKHAHHDPHKKRRAWQGNRGPTKTRIVGPHGEGSPNKHDRSPRRSNADARKLSSSRERSNDHQESEDHSWDPMFADKLQIRRTSSEPVQDAFFKAVVKEGILLDPLSTLPFVS